MLGCPAGTCACAADCRYAALCDVSCPDGCFADCFLGTCTVLCGDFETCEADCASADYCAVTCGAGGACDVDCQGATECAVWCLSGGGNSAACLLDCAGSPTCGFADCPSGAVSCPGGVLACNTACP